MPEFRHSSRSLLQSWLPVFAALVIGLMAGGGDRSPSIAQAEVRETQTRTAFQSGAARSETLLREIASTLKQIDARLQRIEKLAADGNKP